MTGGGGPIQEKDQLTEAEEEIVEMLGPTAIVGDGNVAEPEVNFDFNSQRFEYITVTVDGAGCSSEDMEATSSCRDDTADLVDVETLERSRNEPSQVSSGPKVKTPSKRYQRLQHTVAATENLAQQNKEQLEVMKEYFAKHLKLMEQDIKVKQDISNSLKRLCDHLTNK